MKAHSLESTTRAVMARAEGLTVLLVDLFDTLVVRLTDPDDQKRAWADRVAAHLESEQVQSLSPFLLYQTRIAAESALTRHSPTSEFPYADLARDIWFRLGGRTMGLCAPEWEALCLRLEVDIEIANTAAAPFAVRLLETVSGAGLKIVAVSDYHLPEHAVRDILRAAGLELYFTAVFISSDVGLTKAEGTLFPAVLKALGESPQNCLMIGDSATSDVVNAQAAGITAFRVVRVDSRRANKPQVLARHFSKRRIRRRRGTSRYVGYTFSLLLFIDRLHNRVVQGDYESVVFLAREGGFLRELYALYTRILDVKQVESHYLRVSRRATYLPSCGPLHEEGFEGLLTRYPAMTTETFLKNLGLKEGLVRSVHAELGVGATQGAGWRAEDHLDDLRASRVFVESYEQRRVEQRSNLREYVEQTLGEIANRKIALVDVGWRGTIQDQLTRVFPEASFGGFYLGFESDLAYERKAGLLFTDVPTRSKDYDVWAWDSHFFERLLASPEGPTLEYSSDRAQPFVLELSPDERVAYESVRPLQEQILSYFAELCHDFKNSGMRPEDFSEEITQAHKFTVLHPTLAALRLQRTLYMRQYENFGHLSSTGTATRASYRLQRLFRERVLLARLRGMGMREASALFVMLNAKGAFALSWLLGRVLYRWVR